MSKGVVWLLILAAVCGIAAKVLLLLGCAPGRHFARADLNHYASESETFVSSASATVGRYFTIVPERLEAEAYTGVWHNLDEQRPFGTVGAGLTLYGPADVSVGGDMFAPEDGGELEYFGSLSVEVTWP